MTSVDFKSKGFTIVELLIVIVVIAVLASISVVAFNGVQTRATNTARYSEQKAWEKLFRLYVAQEGRFPTMPNGAYCLGAGFPNIDGSGLGNCRDAYGGSTTMHQVSTTLNSELAKMGSLPSGPRTPPRDAGLGPYVTYYSATAIAITSIVQGDVCPEGTIPGYTYPPAAGRMCNININS